MLAEQVRGAVANIWRMITLAVIRRNVLRSLIPPHLALSQRVESNIHFGVAEGLQGRPVVRVCPVAHSGTRPTLKRTIVRPCEAHAQETL
jgi:hypothetical protein